MRKRVIVQVFDWDFVLSRLDRSLIEHIAHRIIEPFGCDIRSLRFEIVQTWDQELGAGYQATFQTELASGKIVETAVFALEKNKLIGALSNPLRTDLNRRLTLESGFAHRFACWVERETKRLFEPIARTRDLARRYSRQIS